MYLYQILPTTSGTNCLALCSHIGVNAVYTGVLHLNITLPLDRYMFLVNVECNIRRQI